MKNYGKILYYVFGVLGIFIFFYVRSSSLWKSVLASVVFGIIPLIFIRMCYISIMIIFRKSSFKAVETVIVNIRFDSDDGYYPIVKRLDQEQSKEIIPNSTHYFNNYPLKVGDRLTLYARDCDPSNLYFKEELKTSGAVIRLIMGMSVTVFYIIAFIYKFWIA
ncbi:MAG: hypothetical protein PUG48_04580 [Clostridia bacterium]|nr:hypothetical protein [Clostridia bacterium]